MRSFQISIHSFAAATFATKSRAKAVMWANIVGGPSLTHSARSSIVPDSNVNLAAFRQPI